MPMARAAEKLGGRAPEPRRSHVRVVIPHPDETMADNRKTLTDLLAALEAAHATHVLVGGLAAGYYGKPRATVDVDMLIPERAAEKVRSELTRRKYLVEMGELVPRQAPDSRLDV